MKSRITIEVDFEKNNLPVIQILQINSDDVRDKLLQSFLQSLQYTSRWYKINYIGNMGTWDGVKDSVFNEAHKWQIQPLYVSEIPEEIKLMKATHEEWDNRVISKSE